MKTIEDVLHKIKSSIDDLYSVSKEQERSLANEIRVSPFCLIVVCESERGPFTVVEKVMPSPGVSTSSLAVEKANRYAAESPGKMFYVMGSVAVIDLPVRCRLAGPRLTEL